MILHNRHAVPEGVEPTYIGRGTIWGNPFVVGEKYTQGQAADAYRKMLARKLAGKDPYALSLVSGLRAVEHISCSCTPRPCHGDCFVEIYEHISSNNNHLLEGVRSWVKSNGYDFGPESDGKTHINIYTKAKTKLGKFLTNMSNVPVDIPGEGVFQSLEGYWYWLSTGQDKAFFQDCNCFEAKVRGRSYPKVDNWHFNTLFKVAMQAKLEQYPRMLEVFKNSNLPFKHYYHYNEDDRTVVFPPFDWITNEWERLRKWYRGELRSCIIAGSRDIHDFQLIDKAIKDSGFVFDEVVCGEAKGVDILGKKWGQMNGKYVRSFLPHWDVDGKRAGMLRNIDMGTYADMAIVIVKDHSKGSSQMAEYMTKINKPLYRVDV